MAFVGTTMMARNAAINTNCAIPTVLVHRGPIWGPVPPPCIAVYLALGQWPGICAVSHTDDDPIRTSFLCVWPTATQHREEGDDAKNAKGAKVADGVPGPGITGTLRQGSGDFAEPSFLSSLRDVVLSNRTQVFRTAMYLVPMTPHRDARLP